MKRIILTTSLFFCLAITTILAQVATINIDAPSSNGLSNNQVSSFDVNSDGTILNNSAVGGTAQLGSTTVTANPNITAGSEASLILFQVTGSSGSDLKGTIEVFGTEAGVIIANPNGIDCDGCGFINTNRVDLVTGTSNFLGDDLTGFSIDDTAIFFVRNTGFVSDAVADELNLVSRDLRIQAQAKANTTLRVLAGNDTYDHTTNIITSGTTEVSAHSIQINASGYLEANYIELISTEISSSHGIVNSGRDISADSLKLYANGWFRNQDGGNINISGLLEITNAERFINNANITADTLIITTDEFFNNDNGSTQLGKIVVTDIFSLYTPSASYTNTGTVSVDTFALSIAGDFDYASDFLGNGNIDANNQYFTIRNGNFSNTASIVLAGNLGVTANKFNHMFSSLINVYNFNVTTAKDLIINSPVTANNFNATVGGSFLHDSGTINADNFNVTVGKRFDNFAPINADNFNVTVGKSFENYSEVISDIISISAESFINIHALEMGTVSADTFALSIAGDFDYIADYLNNGTITTNAFNLNVDGDFSNNDSANDFTWATQNSLTVLGNASVVATSFNNNGNITVNSFDIIATDFNNSGTISASTTLNTTVSTVSDSFDNTGGVVSADTVSLSVVGDFDYVAEYLNNGTITTNALNLNVGGDFSNNDSANDFTWRTNDILTVLGDANIVAADFENRGKIDVAGNFTVTAGDDFYNQNGATITADNFNVTAGDNFYNRYNATINANDFSVTAGDDFYNQNSATINADSFNVITDNFYNRYNATINANDFNVTARDFSNDNATISANDFNVTAGDFNNNGVIVSGDARDFGNFFIEDVNNLSIVPDGTTSTDAIQSSSGIDIINIARPDSNGLSNNIYSDFNILSSGLVFNNSASAVSSSLAGTIVGNPNYTASDSASLILNQITSNNPSYLGGILEVAGDSAAIIIANPNGIFCDVCSFANTDKVDFITGTANLDAAGLIFDYSIAANDVFIFKANIVLSDFNVTVGKNFFNLGDSTISADNFNVTAGNDFYNNETINANDFNVTAENDFYNYETITVNDFNVTAESNFYNYDSAIITANNFNVTAVDDFYNYATINANDFNVTADSFFNSLPNDSNSNGNIVADTLTLSVAGDFDYSSDFQNNGKIIAINQYFTIRNGDFSNTTSIVLAGDLGITANDFINTSGTVSADTLALSVAGDFDYTKRGIITTNSFNLNVGGAFNNNNSANDFVWATNDILTVSGSANIDAASFNNSGTITVNSFDITATDFTNSGTISANTTLNTTVSSTVSGSFNNTGGEVSADTVSLSVAGDFDYVADFLNNGTISNDALNLTVGGDFSNNDSSSDLDWGVNDSLTVLGSAFVTADSFNNSGFITVNSFDITATDFTNSGTISANTTLNTAVASTVLGSFNNTGGVVSADTFNLNVAGDFDDTKKGIINANYFNLIAGGDFINDDTNNDFALGENDSLIILGDFTITTDNYIQSGMVDVAGALAISAIGDFTNFTTGSISAATLTITVEGTIDNDGTITTTSSLTIDTDRIHNSGSITANSFLTITATNDVFSGGSIETSTLDIDAGRNFGISGSITTDSLNIIAGYTALNTGTIVSASLDLTTDDFFRNLAGGNISVNSLNITAGGKVTNIATINAGNLNIIANNDSSRTNDTTGFYVSNRGDITVTNLINITAVDNFYNTGNLTADTLAIEAKDILLLNTDSIEPYDGGDISLNGDSSFIADGGDGVDGGIIVNRGNIDLGNNILDISADSFINHAGANVTADTLNLTVNSFINDGTIDAVVVSDATIDQ